MIQLSTWRHLFLRIHMHVFLCVHYIEKALI